MSDPRNPTEREVRFARYFLRALYGNQTNGYLLLAVIAWIRGLGSHWVGNNPLGLTSSTGRRLTFATYSAAARYAAQRLLMAHSGDVQGYALLATIAKRSAASAGDQVTQARDFLYALAMSASDGAHHFGVIQPGPYGGYQLGTDQSKNLLVPIWAALTGKHIPSAWFKDTISPAHVVPAKVPFQQARTGLNPIPPPVFISPYASIKFYEDRPHEGSFVMRPE